MLAWNSALYFGADDGSGCELWRTDGTTTVEVADIFDGTAGSYPSWLVPVGDALYFAARVRTAQVIPNPTSTDTVAFGSTVTFRRDDGRVQKYRIVGEDEADPAHGTISYVSPVAQALMGRSIGDVVRAGRSEAEIVEIK